MCRPPVIYDIQCVVPILESTIFIGNVSTVHINSENLPSPVHTNSRKTWRSPFHIFLSGFRSRLHFHFDKDHIAIMWARKV
jgi:hypothetical protein